MHCIYDILAAIHFCGRVLEILSQTPVCTTIFPCLRLERHRCCIAKPRRGCANLRKVNPRRNVYPRRPTSNGIADFPSRIMNCDQRLRTFSIREVALSEQLSWTKRFFSQKRHAKGAFSEKGPCEKNERVRVSQD